VKVAGTPRPIPEQPQPATPRAWTTINSLALGTSLFNCNLPSLTRERIKVGYVNAPKRRYRQPGKPLFGAGAAVGAKRRVINPLG